MELRRKLEQRMEYSKVQALPHDPAMDPNQTIPSYASSTDVMEREAHMNQQRKLLSDRYSDPFSNHQNESEDE